MIEDLQLLYQQYDIEDIEASVTKCKKTGKRIRQFWINCDISTFRSYVHSHQTPQERRHLQKSMKQYLAILR